MNTTYSVKIIVYEISCGIVADPLYPVVEISQPNSNLSRSCIRVQFLREKRFRYVSEFRIPLLHVLSMSYTYYTHQNTHAN